MNEEIIEKLQKLKNDSSLSITQKIEELHKIASTNPHTVDSKRKADILREQVEAIVKNEPTSNVIYVLTEVLAIALIHACGNDKKLQELALGVLKKSLRESFDSFNEFSKIETSGKVVDDNEEGKPH